MKKESGENPEPVGTRSTASQTVSSKVKVRDDAEVAPINRQRPSALLDTRVICIQAKRTQHLGGKDDTWRQIFKLNGENPKLLTVLEDESQRILGLRGTDTNRAK